MVAALSPRLAAHVGSPDVFLDGLAGPYRVLVTVRPPYAVPGVADVEILTTSGDVSGVRIVPLPLTGAGAEFAPVPDVARRSADDPKLFTGHLWMMSAGAWQVRISVSGDRGDGTLSVPVPTLPQATLSMTRSLRALLVGLMLLLCAGFIAIVAAMAREARLGPGETPDGAARRRGRIAAAAATCLTIAAVFFGNSWWSAEASSYARYVYKPLAATPRVGADGRLRLALFDPGWIASRRLDDFVADHGHVMHLFVVSPALDRLWHLHPEETETGVFEHALPDMPAGSYEVFADLVHKTGVSETVTGQFETPAIHGAPLGGDDSAWAEPSAETARLPPSRAQRASASLARAFGGGGKPGPAYGDGGRDGDVGHRFSGATAAADAAALTYQTVDGGRIVWVRDDQTPLTPKQLTLFTFRVEDAKGQPATDLELYMGMPGHAVFVRRDRKVFAHVHPSGSAPMAALAIAMPADADPHVRHGAALASTVSFPFGLPEPGNYVIFVQVKRGGQVQTGVFNARVGGP